MDDPKDGGAKWCKAGTKTKKHDPTYVWTLKGADLVKVKMNIGLKKPEKGRANKGK